MRITFPLLFLFFSVLSFSQSKIIVKNSADESVISGATVSCNNKMIGKTDRDGNLSFRTKCKKVEVSAPGYYEDEVVTDKVMEIFLSKADPKMQNIQTVIVEDKSDPLALAILKKVNENYKANSPRSLDSYSFKSYEKISLDLDQDSIAAYNSFLEKRLDSLRTLPLKSQKEKEKKDSLESQYVAQLMGKSKMFLWERASEFLYSHKYGEKINVLDNRVSGLKQPIYEMMTLRSNRNQIPREIREENRSLYRFFLTDSLDIEGRKNFVIRFREVDFKQPPKRRKFNGYLYVDAETYALKKIESNSRKKSEGSITSIWQPKDGKWFLLKENLKIRMGTTNFDLPAPAEANDKESKNKKPQQKFGNYVYMTADYFDFKSPIDDSPKNFRGYTMEVQNSDGSLLESFRTDSLTAREKETYTKIDSVGRKYNLDEKINIFSGLVKGNIRIGNIDFDASRIIAYNEYEHFRLGAAAKLNEKFNRYISPDAYFAYGFGDRAWKYGAGVDVRTTTRKNSFFRAEYFHDVMAAGSFSQNLWNFRMKIMNSGVTLNNASFYKFDGFRISYQNDITNGITLNFAARKATEEAGFEYNFKNLGNKFEAFSSVITLKFSPNSRNIMTPGGKYTYDQRFPELYLNYEQGFKAAGGDFSFSRFDAMFAHNFKTTFGVTGFRLYGGLLLARHRSGTVLP